MAGLRQKDSVASFSLRSLQTQNGWVKKSESNIKDITGITIAYWCVHIR